MAYTWQYHSFCWWVKQQAVRHVREGVCRFVCVSACFGFLFSRDTGFSPMLKLYLRFKVARVSCVFLVSSWQRLQDFIHTGRQSDCFAVACLHTAGPDPSPRQPQALSQLITLAPKIFNWLCLLYILLPNNYWLHAFSLIMKGHKSRFFWKYTECYLIKDLHTTKKQGLVQKYQ